MQRFTVLVTKTTQKEVHTVDLLFTEADKYEKCQVTVNKNKNKDVLFTFSNRLYSEMLSSLSTDVK